MPAPRNVTETCPLCDGTGWKEAGLEGGARRVTRCDCVLAGRAERLLVQARIPARYEHCELSNFDIIPGLHGDSASRALLVARRFVEEYPLDQERRGLLFVGDVGVGKTHLAVGVLQELIRSKGVPGLFSDYRDLLKQIQNSYNPSVEATEMEVLRPVFETEVLLLDELGAVKPSEWVWDTVSYILNTRYNDRRTTLITTNFPNLPPSGEEPVDTFSRARRAAREESLGDRITERMRSRLHEMCKKVEIEGKDFRQHVKSASFH